MVAASDRLGERVGLHLPGANHRHGTTTIAVECLAADQPLHNLLLAFCQTEVREAVLVGDDLVVHAAEGEEKSVEYAGTCISPLSLSLSV